MLLLNNRYQIEKKIGAGGFGETFLARDTNLPSRRYCVIKQLKPIAYEPQLYQLIQERFTLEATILEKLGSASSHIPSLYAYFEEANQFYLVQEWIEGSTFTEIIQNSGTLNGDHVQRILTECLQTLEIVHHQGIIHRDIKPDNIIVRASDGKPVLIDFGAVKETMSTVMTPSGHQASSIVIGTPGFMPSEQLIGRPVFSSDLYALALSIIYLLTGRVPQELATDPRDGSICWQPANSMIDSPLKAVLDRAIQPHARDRFATAREMLTALQHPEQSEHFALNYAQSSNTEPVEKTVVVSTPPPRPELKTVAAPQSSQSASWQKPLVLGITIGCFILLGLLAIALSLRQSTTIVTVSPTPGTPDLRPEGDLPQPTISSETSQLPVSTVRPTPNPIVSASASPNPDISNPDISNQDIPNQANQNRPSPQQTVLDYYTAINRQDFQTAWTMLPATLREDRKVHPQGFRSFEQWFQQISPLTIEDSQVIQASPNRATVDIKYRGYLGNKPLSMKLRYQLVWDGSQNRWLLQSAQKI